MDLSPYVESVRGGVADAASLADDHTRHVADRLGQAIESSTRLALIQALSDAATTISADLAPSSVELRMAGTEPEFSVTIHAADQPPTLLLPESERPGSSTDATEDKSAGADGLGSGSEPADQDLLDDEPIARVSLRLPQSVKSKVDRAADQSGLSTNAWLMKVVLDSLNETAEPSWPFQPPRPHLPPDATAFFGPHGPFGPNGVFGPHGPFGRVGRLVGGGGSAVQDHPDTDRRAHGNVQGWVQ